MENRFHFFGNENRFLRKNKKVDFGSNFGSGTTLKYFSVLPFTSLSTVAFNFRYCCCSMVASYCTTCPVSETVAFYKSQNISSIVVSYASSKNRSLFVDGLENIH